jgi:DNA-binding transcriptional LysR family regulator
MSAPRISLEQWRALVAVVESGGYAQAAEALHKSQSTLTYAVQKVSELLGIEIFRIEGRKAVLTPAGRVLYRRARGLVDEAARLERGAAEMARDWQPEIGIAVEILFPTWLLLDCLAEFARERPETRIEIYETVRSGTSEMLANGGVHLAIQAENPSPGAMPLMKMRGVPVASADHPLNQLGRPATARDLKQHRRIFIRDSGSQRQPEVEGVELRWTVSNKATSIRALTLGLGYSWMPPDWIAEELASGALKEIPVKDAPMREAQLYIAYADPDFPSRDEMRLAEIIRARTAQACESHRPKVARKGRRARS